MHPTVIDRLAMREYARRTGDVSLERACDADLAKLGYRDPEPMETTAVAAAPERAVPPAKQRRARAAREEEE